jgi:hypothetical protein
MKIDRRTRTWAALASVFLFLCAWNTASVEAGSLQGGGPTLGAAGGNPVRLSLKISGAKKRNRQVSFYKSVARQAKVRASGDRTPSSGR